MLGAFGLPQLAHSARTGAELWGRPRGGGRRTLAQARNATFRCTASGPLPDLAHLGAEAVAIRGFIKDPIVGKISAAGHGVLPSVALTGWQARTCSTVKACQRVRLAGAEKSDWGRALGALVECCSAGQNRAIAKERTAIVRAAKGLSHASASRRNATEGDRSNCRVRKFCTTVVLYEHCI